MKSIFPIALLLLSTFSQAQIINIPDTNFKNALVNTNCVDTDGDGIGDIDADIDDDGEIQQTEADLVTALIVSNNNIESLDGIQNFLSLERLTCFHNELTSLDLSQNLNLEWLRCQYNNLTNLNVTQNLNLEWLQCSYNQLTSLEISQNSSLTNLDVYSNPITNIDLTQNSSLESFNCSDTLLTSLDVTQNSTLTILKCYGVEISSLDVTQNPNLFHLDCGSNSLFSLDVSQNPELRYLSCGFNLTELNLSQNPNLERLFCSSNQFTSLDLSQNPNLNYFQCTYSLLSNLNIKNGNNSNLTQMTTLYSENLFCITVDDETNNPICDYSISPPQGWCIDEWTEYSEDCILSVSDLNSFEISIYPNPVKNVLYINTEFPIDLLKIYTLQGQLINETKNNQIDISLLSSGLYFASIIIDGKNSVKMFIKD